MSPPVSNDIAMRTVKAVYENGHLIFPEGTAPEGRMEVVIVFPEQGEKTSVDAEARDKDAGKRFVQECFGILRGRNTDNWKDEKVVELERAH